jgi:hypothetical protein
MSYVLLTIQICTGAVCDWHPGGKYPSQAACVMAGVQHTPRQFNCIDAHDKYLPGERPLVEPWNVPLPKARPRI